MVDRRCFVVQKIEKFLLGEEEQWRGQVHFEEPPQLDGSLAFDLALPCFPMAKLLRKAPQKIAAEWAEKLSASDLPLEKVEAVNAYVNVRFTAAAWGEILTERVAENFGAASKSLEGERIVIDSSSPNIAKPFGIGHLRSTNIGAAISRIYSSLGAEVVRVNHLGDWGTQFGKLITAYKRFGNADFVRGDAINNLYKLYVKFHEEEQKDPELLDEAREWFVKLEKSDDEARELWSWFKDVSYREFKKIYERLGVEFDYVTGESYYNDHMQASITRLEEAKLLKESDGAVVVDLEDYGMPPCLIRKTDGSTLYATRDIATAEYRWDTFEPTRLVYVVGGEQKLHFKQVFKVLELMGHDWASKAIHVDFGLIKFPEGKMSTRKGNIILLEDVLKQANEEALKIINKKHGESSDLTEKEKEEISQAVGDGAVLFFDLKARRTKDVLFEWSEILSFDGDTGPYLQYTNVRLLALLEKAREANIDWTDARLEELQTEEERALIRRLAYFPGTVEAAARDFEPSMISHELLDLAGVFNQFYNKVPVLKGDEDLMRARMLLVELTQQILSKGLSLLGIPLPTKM